MMEIIRNDSDNRTYFGALELGDVFECDGELYIKFFADGECYGLDLKTFGSVGFFGSDGVILKNAELVIT